jgi:hypothetical protein
MKWRIANIHALVQTDTKSVAMVPGTLVDLATRFAGGETLADLLGPLGDGFAAVETPVPAWQPGEDADVDDEA